MKNKTATECWNILRGDIDSAIDTFVHYEKARETVKEETSVKRGFQKDQT